MTVSPIFLPKRAGNESANGMRLPRSRSHQLAESHALRAFHQIQNRGALAASAGAFRFRRRLVARFGFRGRNGRVRRGLGTGSLNRFPGASLARRASLVKCSAPAVASASWGLRFAVTLLSMSIVKLFISAAVLSRKCPRRSHSSLRLGTQARQFGGDSTEREDSVGGCPLAASRA